VYAVNRTKPLTQRRIAQLEAHGQGFEPLTHPLEFTLEDPEVCLPLQGRAARVLMLTAATGVPREVPRAAARAGELEAGRAQGEAECMISRECTIHECAYAYVLLHLSTPSCMPQVVDPGKLPTLSSLPPWAMAAIAAWPRWDFIILGIAILALSGHYAVISS
jgi:hypothetical protein